MIQKIDSVGSEESETKVKASFKINQKSAFTGPSNILCIKKITDDSNEGIKFHSKTGQSTENCINICKSGKTCPELLPINCESFRQGGCDCVGFCKKALDLVTQFGNPSQKPVKKVEKKEVVQQIANDF